MEGKQAGGSTARRSWLDALLVSGATAIFVVFGAMAIVPRIEFSVEWLIALAAAMLIVLAAGVIALGRITRFK